MPAAHPAYVVSPPPQAALPILGSQALFPVRRVYCIGRNYAAHAVEMGHDPERAPPFFFQKAPDSLDASGEFPYPVMSAEVHHEAELLVALGQGGQDIAEAEALEHVWGYGLALDMTRRDLQGQAKAAGRPWEIGKSFEHAAPVAPLLPATEIGHPHEGDLRLTVNGDLRQQGNLNQMIWKIPEIIAHLSRYYRLAAGDVILTGTPAGVGPVQRGDVMELSCPPLTSLRVEVV
ncbi:fumarylacetoacetate hydrolase family protein [Epibacterium sp. Ofav1-8]|uniref:fumarylacetoacetate hydrolase family protein n=1 Tax=Epibacterium sp. Ofav1-8 TaxID=2917735 RepID=UPI001EF58D8A|nr:fumarylacetoacetate hydrolase family protein [Epibacterium sp. Ofav1-8]MCG7624264.1 fumarylacetoacetate hydrolase family protein [Epibacterium sp. Ofav1-8]